MDPFEDDAPDNTPDGADDAPTAGDIMGVVALVDGIAAAWTAVRDAGLPDDARGALQGVLLRAIAALAPEAPPNPPMRTAEDARFDPQPGDRMTTEGSVYTATGVENGVVHTFAEDGLRDWYLDLWSIDDGCSTWIPAGAE